MASIANQIPNTHGGVLSLLAEMLVAAGWTYKSSGDGVAAFNNTGKVFTNTNAGALGWDNAGAWARLADPANRREFVLVRDSTLASVRIKFSPLAKFTGGSATVFPTATDEKYIAGTASTGSSAWAHFGVTVRSCVFFGFAQSSAPYGFWIAGGFAYRGLVRSALVVDPVRATAADPDPYVYLFNGTQGAPFLGNALSYNFFFPNVSSPSIMSASGGITSSSNEFPYGNMDPAGAVTGYLPLCAAAYQTGPVANPISSHIMYHSGGSQNPFDGSLEAYPIVYQRPVIFPISGFSSVCGYTGVKGWSTFCHWITVPRVNWDLANNKTLISVGSVWLPWDGTTTPLGY